MASTSFRSSCSSPSQPPRPRLRRFPCLRGSRVGNLHVDRGRRRQRGLVAAARPESDLPCFVEHTGDCIKCNMVGTVRMETPGLYIYAPRQVNVDVKVGFNKERSPSGIRARWSARTAGRARTLEGQSPGGTSPCRRSSFRRFRPKSGASHYYKARNTDSTPLQSGRKTEKFLFYRGVGQFAPPIAAAVQPDGKTTVSTKGAPIGDVIMFENRKGTVAFEVAPRRRLARHARPAVAGRRGLLAAA